MTDSKHANLLEACVFCGSTRLRRTHSNLYHTFKMDHGPFEFHNCEDCGSGLTLDPPSAERLGELYSSYQDGLPELHREIMQDDSQSDLYEHCARRMLMRAPDISKPAWIDVGAGGGECGPCPEGDMQVTTSPLRLSVCLSVCLSIDLDSCRVR